MDNFVMFEDDIENLNGLSNYDNFIYELSDLLNIAYSSRYTESDKNINDGFYSNVTVPIYLWQDTWTDIVTKVEWNKWGNNKYSFDSEQDYNYFLPNYGNENYYFNSGTREYEFYPGNMIYVYLEGDIGFAPKGEIIRMPAFQLAYLLNLEQAELLTKAADWIITPISVVIGAAGLRGASWLYKLYYTYNATNFLLDDVLKDVFNVNYRNYLIQNYGTLAEDFFGYKDRFDALLATYQGVQGFRYSVEHGQIVQGLFESWDALNISLENNNDARNKKAAETINKLKKDLGYDETIAY